MARELSPTLEAQQKLGIISQPYLIAKIRRKWGGVIRYDWDEMTGGPGPATLRPNAPGDETNLLLFPDTGEANWEDVCDVTPDEDSSYVFEGQAGWIRDLYSLPNPDASGIITSVKVYARCKATAEPLFESLKICAKTGGDVFESDVIAVTTSYANYSKTWTDNPKTEVAWTWADIDALQVGVSLLMPDIGGDYTRCTQIYVEVTYTVWTYTDTDYLHTAAMPSDGSLIRLRVTPEVDSRKLYYQRVTSPDDASDFKSWQYLSIDDVIAIASAASGVHVSQFYVNTDGECYQRISADSGASWGAWTLIHSYWTVDCVAMDASYNSSGDICLIFTTDRTKCEYAETGTDGQESVYGVFWKGQNFSPGEKHTLTSISLFLSRIGTSVTCFLKLYLADVNGYPTGAALDTVSFASSTITDDPAGAWYSFDITYALLAKDTEYVLELSVPTGDATHALLWFYNSGNPYTRGIAITSVDSGANWADIAGTDFYFREYGYHSKTGNPLALIYKETNGKTWGLGSANTNTIRPSTGISVFHTADWNIVGTYGGEDEDKGVAICIYGDDGDVTIDTWEAWDDIISRVSTEPYNYLAPFVRRPDTTRLYFVEQYTQAETQDRLYYSHSPAAADFQDNAWLEPVPMNVESVYGLCPSKYGSYAWLTNANKVYRALATDDELDISSKLLIVDMRQYPDIRKGYVTITVNNLAGIYNNFARLGDELTIGIGYKTSEGNEYSLASSFWVTKYKLVSPSWSIWRSIYPTGILGTLVIEAQDAWDFLKRYKTRRTLSWEAGEKSVKDLLQYFIARSGLTFEVLSASDAATNFKPELQVSRGTTYRTIVKNLLKMIPDQLIFREFKAILRNPTTAESVDWTYHNTIGVANLVFRGKYGSSAWDPNRVEVWADTFMKMQAEWPQIQSVRDRLTRVTTPTYPDLTRAGERADAELRVAEILTGEESEMLASVNCGLEPWDKIQITDQASGVTDILRRVIRLKTYWSARSWLYTQSITLGAD